MQNDRILRRIKSLLALAEGETNINESHSAFLQAQEMMVKYGVDPSEITGDEETREVLKASVTDYKRLFWYEREIANIIARNFRCKGYIRSKYVSGKKQAQKQIVFMGLESDVELANEMYRLVISAVEFYTMRHVRKNGIGVKHHTQSLKNDYMRGFIYGLERKFEEQIKEQEWGLVLVIPKEVEVEFKNTVTGYSTFKMPHIQSSEHYVNGYRDGNAIDYKKETIDEELELQH